MLNLHAKRDTNQTHTTNFEIRVDENTYLEHISDNATHISPDDEETTTATIGPI